MLEQIKRKSGEKKVTENQWIQICAPAPYEDDDECCLRNADCSFDAAKENEKIKIKK